MGSSRFYSIHRNTLSVGNEIFIGFIIHRLRGRIFLCIHVNCEWDFIVYSKFGLRSDKGILLHKHRQTLNYIPIFLLTIQWIGIR